MANEDKEPRDVVDRAREVALGKETADKIKEHNKEIDNFGKKPEPSPSPKP